MKKRIVLIMTALMVFDAGATSQILSPLRMYYPPFHLPYAPMDDSDHCFQFLSSVYARTADKAFRNKKCGPQCPKTCHGDCGNTSTAVSANSDSDSNLLSNNSKPLGTFNGVTTKKVPLAALTYGKSSFRGEEAFAGGILLNCYQNPYLAFAVLSPRFDYNEFGLFLGFDGYQYLNEDRTWVVGGRVNIPIKVIDVQQVQNKRCCFEQREEKLANVIGLQTDVVDIGGVPTIVPGFAYRFDFLNALQTRQGNCLVTYNNGGVQIAGIDITAAAGSSSFIDVDRVAAGTLPTGTFFVPSTTVPALTPLPANGMGPDGTYFFCNQTACPGIDYSGLAIDRATQGQLFLVPSDGGTTTNLMMAFSVQNIIQDVLNSMTITGNASAEAFFRNCCIYFCQADRIIGVGDLDVQLYAGYHQEKWLLDGIVGARFPTGKKDKHPGQTLFFPTGNNGHFELELGINSGWHPIDWFGIMLKGYYSHVFNHVEKKAAAFAGATVINIGTPVDANVSWNYGFAQLDFNFFHPKNPDLGGSIGYEIYAKQHDKVRFCQDTAVDCLGRTEPLDSCLLERNTNTLTNKIRGEFFNRFYYWELFAGASYIFAGRNAVQEIEGHVGVTVYF